ncbi:MAG TPA: recombinase family protein [Armatimonadota bacterium]|jgi:site-specific DNA recombinase
MMRIGTYTRVSSMGQLEGHSLETQSTRIRQLAEGQFGEGNFEIVAFEEKALSGSYPPAQLARAGDTKQRPALTRLLEEAEAGRLDAVFFYSVSRLGREESVSFGVTRHLKQLGIPCKFMDVDADPDTDEGAMIVGISHIFAATHLRQHKRRVTDGWHRRTELGFPPGGRVPYGFQWQTHESVPPGGRRTYVRQPEQAEWALVMKERYLAGWSTLQIADHLRSLGVLRPSGANCDWDSCAVRQVLVCPIGAGLIKQSDGTMIQGQHWEERLWEPEERDLMCQRLERNRRVGARGGPKASLLAGIITCRHCGSYLAAMRSHSTGKVLYQCRTNDHRRDAGCPRVGRLAEPIDKAVLQEISQLALSPEVQQLAMEQSQDLLSAESNLVAEHVEGLRRQRGQLQSRIDRLVDMRSADEIDAAQFREQNARLRQEREELDNSLALSETALQSQSTRRVELEAVRRTLQSFSAVWAGLDPAEQREALRTIIEYAQLEKAEGEDLLLRLKLVFLPERVLPMPSYTKRKAQTGPDSLTPRNLAYLKHKQSGLSDESVASMWETTTVNIGRSARKIFARLQVHTVEEAIALAARRLEEESHALPLLGRLKKVSETRVKFTWTAKRRSLLEALAAGRPRREITASANITPKTLTEHLSQMKKAAGVSTVEELLAYAKETGLIS